MMQHGSPWLQCIMEDVVWLEREWDMRQQSSISEMNFFGFWLNFSSFQLKTNNFLVFGCSFFMKSQTFPRKRDSSCEKLFVKNTIFHQTVDKNFWPAQLITSYTCVFSVIACWGKMYISNINMDLCILICEHFRKYKYYIFWSSTHLNFTLHILNG